MIIYKVGDLVTPTKTFRKGLLDKPWRHKYKDFAVAEVLEVQDLQYSSKSYQRIAVKDIAKQNGETMWFSVPSVHIDKV